MYKRPHATALVLGGVDRKALDRLYDLLKVHGSRGLRVYVLSTGSAKELESLREFVQSNYTFTVEIYIVSDGELKTVIEREGSNIVKIMVSGRRVFSEILGNGLEKLVEVLTN